jgi:hypothetical protein
VHTLLWLNVFVANQAKRKSLKTQEEKIHVEAELEGVRKSFKSEQEMKQQV